MSKALQKTKPLAKKARQQLTKYEIDLKVGDEVIDITDGYPEPYRVSKITGKYIELYHRYTDSETGEKEWSHYGDIEFDEFRKNYIKLTKPIEEHEADAIEQLKHLDDLIEDKPTETGETTALAKAHSKEVIVEHKALLKKQTEKFALMMAMLDRKRGELQCHVENLIEQTKQVMKVIDVIELYMGIHEEVFQIQKGEPAPADEPIKIRQMLLFMDEEVGLVRDGGLDFKNLEAFDEWVTKPKNLARILPEQKGVVAMRIRRKMKDYDENAFVNAAMNAGNFETYLLIRNGLNIYRVWSNVRVNPRLFPTKKELKDSLDGNHDHFDEEDLKESIFEYKKYGLMLQGLLHRTQIFAPLKESIDIFDYSTWEGKLVFIRDDESQLPSGRLPWREWREKINSELKTGSRIVFIYNYRMDTKGRVTGNNIYIDSPGTGLYVVAHPSAEMKGSMDYRGIDLKRFLYNPGGTVWKPDDWEYVERKNRVGWVFYNDEVLNYDKISLDDIDFYLESRIDRHHYLKMIPILKK